MRTLFTNASFLRSERLRGAALQVALAVVVASLLAACGTARITGRVVDERKKPIKAASVETDPPTDYIVTNHMGFFAIARFLDETNTSQPLKEGPYKVTIKKLGYRDKVVPVEIKGRSEAALGDIVLKRKRIQMDTLEDVAGTTDSGPGAGDLPPPVMGE